MAKVEIVEEMGDGALENLLDGLEDFPAFER